MTCRNCGGSGGKKGNKHVRGGRFTCTRYSGGQAVADVSLGGLSDWTSRDESGSNGGNDYNSCGSGGGSD